jgi:hypothetical protein
MLITLRMSPLEELSSSIEMCITTSFRHHTILQIREPGGLQREQLRQPCPHAYFIMVCLRCFYVDLDVSRGTDTPGQLDVHGQLLH